MTTADQPQRPRFQINGLTVLSLIASFFGACAVLLHFVGDIAHRHYLGFWGIESGVFQKSTEWLLVNGYYGVFGRFAMLLSAFARNLHWVLLVTLLAGLYFFLIVSPTRPVHQWGWYSRINAHWRRLINCMAFAVWLAATLITTLLIATVSMGAVGILGESAGKASAERNQSEFVKGCANAKPLCTDVIKDGHVVMTGFVLDSSQTHLAILDVTTRRGRVIERAGFETAAHPKRPIAP